MPVQYVQFLGVLTCIGMVLAMLPRVYQGELFAWHPLFMAVGFLGFMTEGILTAVRFRPNEGMSRVVAIQNHGLIQAASSACVALGFYAIFRNKILKGKLHFTSLHGKVGLIATGVTALSSLLGVSSFRKLGIIQRFPEDWQPRIKWLHRMVSVCCWTLALVDMLLILPHRGIMTGWVARAWQGGLVACALLMMAVLRSKWGWKSPLPTAGQAPRGPKAA